MGNPFTAPTVCSDCNTEIMQIDAFPGNRCIDCYGVVFDSLPPVDVQRTLRGSVNL